MPPNFDPHLSDPPWHEFGRCRPWMLLGWPYWGHEDVEEAFPAGAEPFVFGTRQAACGETLPPHRFKHIIKNTIEMIAFTPPMPFHLCCELLLESLIDSGQDTSYLTTARQGGSLIATMLFGLGFKFSTLQGRTFNLCPSGGGGELAQ